MHIETDRVLSSAQSAPTAKARHCRPINFTERRTNFQFKIRLKAVINSAIPNRGGRASLGRASGDSRGVSRVAPHDRIMLQLFYVRTALAQAISVPFSKRTKNL